MELQLIRSATIKIKYAGKTILVDPMLPKNTSAPFAE
jgi:L-ascorbate metabolism protein UlaG (beta-lactamase superfamily)